VLETAVAQLRFAYSLALGRPFHTASLDCLIESLRETQREFGPDAITPEGAELIGGPKLDDATRHDMQLRRFREQAKRAARYTQYYARLFAELGLNPTRLSDDDIVRLPLTSKDALRDVPEAFVRRGATPVQRAMTTGTTGWPTSVHFSAYELRVIVALSALGMLFDRQLAEDDIVQINTSSRATLGNLGLAGACAQIGALAYLTGAVDPAHTLALLAERHHLPGKKNRASAMSIYPSYLGEIVEAGLALGYKPADFGLERVFVGGEIVTEGVKRRAQQLFGTVCFVQGYAMTETIPLGGRACADGHLHFEPSHGLVEVIEPPPTGPAAGDAPGSIVVTPFAPYRETTLLLRYDTEDMVRLAPAPLKCDLRNLPATTDLLGKRRLSVRHDAGWTFPRDVLEALESLEEVPLPARCGFWAVRGGVAVEVVTRNGVGAVARSLIADRLESANVPVKALHLRNHPDQLQRPLPLRCDLKEASFGGGPTRQPSDAATPLRPIAAHTGTRA
jgi:phenylacetate-coenzyme A ligase PaaK-like adenylate-forming protein